MKSIFMTLIVSLALPITASALALKNLPAGSKIVFTNSSEWIVPAGESAVFLGLLNIQMHKKLKNNTDFRGYSLTTADSAVLNTETVCNDMDCHSKYESPVSVTLKFENKHFVTFTFGRGSSQQFKDVSKTTVEDLNEAYKGDFKIIPNEEIVKP